MLIKAGSLKKEKPGWEWLAKQLAEEATMVGKLEECKALFIAGANWKLKNWSSALYEVFQS